MKRKIWITTLAASLLLCLSIGVAFAANVWQTGKREDSHELVMGDPASYEPTVLLAGGSDALTKNPTDVWTGTFAAATDGTYGDVWSVAVTTRTANVGFLYSPGTHQAIETVVFYVYNDSNSNCSLVVNNTTVADSNISYPLVSKAWTRIELSYAEFAARNKIMISYPEQPSSFMISSVCGINRMFSVAHVDALIDALPVVGDVEPYHKYWIDAAKKSFDRLGASAQAGVSDAEKLTACVNAVAGIKTIFSGGANTLKKVTSGHIWDGTFTGAMDATYGNVWRMFVESASGDGKTGSAGVSYAAPARDDIESVVFYVYNGGTNNRGVLVNKASGGTNITTDSILGQWTRIELTWDEFKDRDRIVFSYPTANASYMYSSVYGISHQTAADDVTKRIEALPEVGDVEVYHTYWINAAKAAYDKLSATAKALVDSNAVNTLTACVNAAAEYEVLFAGGSSALTKNAGDVWTGTFMAGMDTDYGAVWSIDIETRVSNVGFIYAPPARSDIETVVFYVHNGGTTNFNVVVNNSAVGGTNISTSAIAGQWTRIELTWEEFAARNKIILSYPQAAKQYMISSIYGIKTAD